MLEICFRIKLGKHNLINYTFILHTTMLAPFQLGEKSLVCKPIGLC